MIDDTRAPKKPSKAKYQVIIDQLLSQIEDGVWAPGDKLPSEDQLAEQLAFSLGTVQRALRSLAEMGVVERRHGAGTFVSRSRAPEQNLKHFRFKAEGGTELLPIYFKVLHVDLTRDTGPWSVFFGPDETEFVHIQRLVSVNREFEVFSEIYLPASRFGSIAEQGQSWLDGDSWRSDESWLDGVSFRDMLIERFNAPTLKTTETIQCQTLPPRVVQRIGVAPGQTGVIWSICGTSYRDAPITWQRVFVPPSDRGIEFTSERVR